MRLSKPYLFMLSVMALAVMFVLLSPPKPVFGQASGIGSIDANIVKNAVYCPGTGSANVETCVTTQTFASYVAGQMIVVKMAATNTGATTINVNGLGAKAVTKNGTTALAANDLLIGGLYMMTYDGTEFVVTQNLGGIVTPVSIANGGTGTGSTLTGLVRGSASAMTAAELSGDCTTSGSNAVTCTQLNGANFTVSTAGIPTKIDGITTTGLGVPVVGWKSNVTGQSTSQTTVTLATAPTAGDYEIHYFADMNTACTTGSNSVAFTFNWTDASNARVLNTGSLGMGSAQTTTSYISGIIPLHVGSGNVTYTSTVTGTCATGTSSYDINAWMVRAN